MLTIDASNLPRFMVCNGYRLLPIDPLPTERDDTIREEGNAAHWLASVVFSGQHTIEEMVDRKAPNGIYITAEMAEYVREYLNDLTPNDRIEWGYALTGSNWQINGRGDCIGLSPSNKLIVRDFKYGYSIVEPENNWTLIAHAVGYCFTNGVTPHSFEFVIHQPRAPHRDGTVRRWEVSADELMKLYNQMQMVLSRPSETLQTSQQCYKCPAFTGCPARQDAELNALEVSHMAYRAEIDNADIVRRLALIHRADEMLKQSKKAYEEQIMHRLQTGQIIDNYAIEIEYTNRVWKDGVSADWMQALTGFNLTKPAMITPKQAETTGVPKEIVALFAERRSKGSKLVKVDANKRAAKFFGAKR